MALIKNAASGAIARDAVVLDLGDLQGQAKRLREQAQAEAASILSEARKEREALLASARDEGFASGHAEGVEAGKSQGREDGKAAALAENAELIRGAVDALQSVARAFGEQRAELIDRASDTVALLGVEIARRLTRKVFEAEPELVREQVRGAVELALDPTRVVISAHPEDVALLEESVDGMLASMSRETHATLLADESLDRGSCVLRTDQGMIDASIGGQIQEVVAALVGTRSAHRLEEMTGQGEENSDATDPEPGAPEDGGS